MKKLQTYIKNYPSNNIFEADLDESLMQSYPVDALYKKLKKEITGIRAIFPFRLQPEMCFSIKTRENKGLEFQMTYDDYVKQEECLTKIMQFYGYYVNHVDEYTEIPFFIAYPKFQSRYALPNEKFLVHVTASEYVPKILRQGLRPDSKVSKLERINSFNHNPSDKVKYQKLKDSWSYYQHPDKIHFFVGSKVKEFLTEKYLQKFFNTVSDNLSIIIIDLSKLPSNYTVCVDPNSTYKYELITVFSDENISSEAISQIININKNTLEKLTNLYEILEK